MTFDPGWSAALDGAPLAAWPTAAGQLGVRLPAGEHLLALRYREPLLAAGAAVTLAALLAAGALFLWAGRSTGGRGPTGVDQPAQNQPA
jgi:uncharacterized membrane protein YfhO